MGFFAYFAYSKSIQEDPQHSESFSDSDSDSNLASPTFPLAVQSTPNLTRPRQSPPRRLTKRLSPRPSQMTVNKPLARRLLTIPTVSSDKKAKQGAYAVRSLILGPSRAHPTTKVSRTSAVPHMSKAVKSQLTKPKSANKVIAHLRSLSSDTAHAEAECVHGPIHAVCLSHTDIEEEQLHFAKLKTDDDDESSLPTIISAPLEKLAEMFSEMDLINLLTDSPDLGIGQPGDAPGILSGAVPTAETVLNGITQITPQLMALGFATGKALTPDHTGIYPPEDRMSVLTYWWGFELTLPPPSLAYLGTVQSISGSVMNFLSAVAMINNGVREILPFVRYVSQFIDFEFNAIKAQNKGRGVVLAATWIMPAALVPRPWDFAPRPAGLAKASEKSEMTEKIPAEAEEENVSIPSPVLSLPVAQEPVPPPSVTITAATPSVESIAAADRMISDMPATPPRAVAVAA